jgi:tRNA/tmRNA/rRNA uracil-C5-methylase (TrmA/RlmC/RlmD family)
VIGGRRLRFGPNSFFQGNPWQTEALYRHVAERCEGRVTDLFCGVGGFSVFAAAKAASLVGIDNNAESIDFARHNAAANGVAAKFYIGDSGRFVEDMNTDTLILDPTRAGLGPKFVRKVVRAKPERIVYVSCNPKALAEELPGFEGYRIEEMTGFDLFPRTPHVETVALLSRK